MRSTPPNIVGWIKLNVDAEISDKFSILDVVARDDNGEVIQVWAKLYELCSPLQAEAAAIHSSNCCCEKMGSNCCGRGCKIFIDSLVPMSSKEKQVH